LAAVDMSVVDMLVVVDTWVVAQCASYPVTVVANCVAVPDCRSAAAVYLAASIAVLLEASLVGLHAQVFQTL
jgi:flagellar biosynthesis protein FliQ